MSPSSVPNFQNKISDAHFNLPLIIQNQLQKIYCRATNYLDYKNA